MDTQRPFTPAHRDQALRRLRIITVGAAATSLAAVAGFGGVAGRDWVDGAPLCVPGAPARGGMAVAAPLPAYSR